MGAILRAQNNFTDPDNFLFISKDKTFPIPKSHENKYYILKPILMKVSYKNYEEYSKTLYTLTNIYR